MAYLGSHSGRSASKGYSVRQARPVSSRRGVRGQVVWLGLGGLLLLTGAGFWAVPMADAATTVLKVGASIAVLGAAWLCATAARPAQEKTKVEFDGDRNEIRVMERDKSGQFFIQQRHNLAHVGQLAYLDDQLKAWDLDGEELLSVPVKTQTGQSKLHALFAG